MSSMFRALLREIPGAIGGAITGAAQKAGDLMGQAMVIPTKMAFEAVISEMKDVFNNFNPGLQIVKAFNEFNKVQERIAAMNLNRDKLLEKARSDELKELKGSYVETSKSMATNFEAGLKPNNVQLLKLQETMRFTGQKTDSLMKSMIALSYSTGGNQEAIKSLIDASDKLRDKYGISSEKLFDAISKLDKESQDLAAIYGESPMLAEIGASLEAMSAGQIPQDQLNAILRLFYVSDEQNLTLRSILGIQDEFFQGLQNLDPEKRDKILFEEIKRANEQLQKEFVKGNQGVAFEAIRADLKSNTLLTAISNFSKLNLEELQKRKEGLKLPGVEEADRTMIAVLEQTRREMEERLMQPGTLENVRDQMINIARTLNEIPAGIAKALIPLENAIKDAGRKVGGDGRVGGLTPEQREEKLKQISDRIYNAADTYWDSTDELVDSFVRTMGKTGEAPFLQLGELGPQNIKDFLSANTQTIVDRIMDQRGEGGYEKLLAGYAPFNPEDVPTQINSEFRDVMQSVISELKNQASLFKEGSIEQNEFIKSSFKALENVDILDYERARTSAGSKVRSLLEQENTVVQIDAIKGMSELLQARLLELKTQAIEAKNKGNRDELAEVNTNLLKLKSVIEDQNEVMRNEGLKLIDLGLTPGVGGF